MLDPFLGRGLVLAAATHPDYLAMMREVISALGAHALLLRGTEREPFANPKRRPRIEYLHDGAQDVLFEAEHDSLKTLPHLPETVDALTTADWDTPRSCRRERVAAAANQSSGMLLLCLRLLR